MKILKSCGSPSWGGLEIYIIRTVEKLMELGHDVSIACLPNSNIENQAREKGIKVLPVIHKGFRRLKSIFKLKKFLSQNNIDVIHTHLSNDLWVLVPALKLSGSKAKLTLSKGLESGVSKKDLFHRFLYNRVDKIIAVSNFIKSNVLKTCPVDESRVMVIPDAIQLEKYNPDLFDKKNVKKELGFDESQIIIGMVGRMSPGKGHEILFESARRLMNSDWKNKIKFLVVGGASFGEEDYEKKLLADAEKYGLKEIMEFTGFQSNTPYYLSAMDILAFPSNEESFGGTLLEAMAMKLPVAASDSGGVPDIVINGVTGLLIPRNNPDALTKALIQLIENKELRDTMGNNGRKRVEQHFEMTENIKLFEKIYGR
jgi:glycosyltransferase involved in cell wall biosynthesis